MKIAKTNSPPELALQYIENFLQTNDMTITQEYDGLHINFVGRSYALRDIEMGDATLQLPRMVDSERMVAE